ncbi:hypothetical protein VNO78_03557 [Psophocarpus tetragonolobus]|uniref:ENTH domain-containing protein n=1 Tax=Psophocarpus tetragonolobus TaxID=3891 RepID=A0AAN9XVP3_PSOTE
MAPSSKLRRALGAVKDQTSIGLAKVGSSTSLADLDVAIVKATRHDEYPAEEKHIREILSLTCYSRAFISACVNTLARRLNKTKSWTVALKTLILIQRLLLEGDPAYEQEIFFSTRRGTRLLNMSDFRDNSKSDSWDFSAFVRTYALYLDERLEYKMQSRRGKRSIYSFDEDEEERERERDRDTEKEIIVRSTPVHDMKLEQIFSKMQHLQLLLERFLACRPTGGAKNHRIVTVALYPIVKESFQMYYDISEILSILIDRFPDMEVAECVKVYDFFCRVGKQFDELDLFYGWSKSIGIARSSEYPEIERVTLKKLEVMEEFIKDKSVLAQSNRSKAIEYIHMEEEEEEEEEEEVEEEEEAEVAEEDVNATKALPAPAAEERNEELSVEEVKEEAKVVQTEGDLLNLGDEMMTSEAHGEQMGLALFDGEGAATSSSGTQALPWHAFEEGADWETALVQSTSKLGNQKPSYGGGFDSLLLDGMYKQAEMNAVMERQGYGTSGSASSMAGAGGPANGMLALPAPSAPSSDPFAASLAVAPPSYVQMSEMEKKQKLLLQEQMLWQQYAKDGMQGQPPLAKLHSNNNNNNSYIPGYPQYYGNYYR